MQIQIDDPRRAPVAELLLEHLAEMASHSLPESNHALDIDELRAPAITFWTASEGDELLGCAALVELDARHGEIKSMRTAGAHRRKGVAAALLRHVLVVASERAYARLYLETGSMDAFAPARTMYANFGFEHCPPFGSYVPDRLSVFMTKKL